MGTIKLSGTNGTVSLVDGNPTGDITLTLPNVNGTVATTEYLQTTGFTKMQYETTKTASGTSVDFTGIPSWAKRITVMFNGVSTNGTSLIEVRLGTASQIENTGYTSYCYGGSSSGSNIAGTISTTGFIINRLIVATSILSGAIVLDKSNDNNWVEYGNVNSNTHGGVSSGSKTLSGVLDSIRITTVSGTDVFDAGTINILIEG